jgi:uncharacterized hydrophobic protein (TIGR00271 family)
MPETTTRWTIGAILVGRRADRCSLEELEGKLFLDQSDAVYKFQRFGLLLVLSSIIASGGIVVDSTATVIGAMIVAPLGVPIMGVALATVVGVWQRLTRAIAGVVVGAAGAAAIGALMSIFVPRNADLLANPQIAGRVNPSLVDMLVALAVGFVAAIGMMRKDLSDVLPGVAIAISLVPPMCVVGITAAEGQWAESAGALILFATNVIAMITAGIIVFGLARYGQSNERVVDINRGRVLGVVLAALVVLAIPLGVQTWRYIESTNIEQKALVATQQWVMGTRFSVMEVTIDGTTVDARIIGTGEPPDINALAARLGPEYTVRVDVQEGELLEAGPL